MKQPIINLPLVSIIVPVKNEEDNLPRLLASIKKLNYPKEKIELIIVDGGSTDKTLQIAKDFKLNTLINKKGIRGAGCRLGVSKAKGTFIAFTDADCVVPRNWLIDLLKQFRDKEIVSVGGPNVTPKDDSEFAKAAGEVIWLLTRIGARYGFSGNKVVETYHNPGCNVIYRKDAILAAGNFDSVLLTCEDEELDFRLRQAGLKLLFTPDVCVDHYRRPTFKRIFTQAYRFAAGRAQAIKMCQKMASWFHFGPTLLLLSLILAIIPGIFNHWLLSFLYLGVLFLGLVFVSTYLCLKNKKFYLFTYMGIFIYWFLGWSLGFLHGLVADINSV